MLMKKRHGAVNCVAVNKNNIALQCTDVNTSDRSYYPKVATILVSLIVDHVNHSPNDGEFSGQNILQYFAVLKENLEKVSHFTVAEHSFVFLISLID